MKKLFALLACLWLWATPAAGDGYEATEYPPLRSMVPAFAIDGGSLQTNVYTFLLSADEYELPDCAVAYQGHWVIVSTYTQLAVEIGLEAGSNDTIYHGRISPKLDQYDELDSPNVVPGETVGFYCGASANAWMVFTETGSWTDGGVPD